MSKRVQGSTEQRKLAGKGGVGLVMFHLARRHVEFAITLDDCQFGDIWARVGSNTISIEVKTSRQGRSWIIRRPQAMKAADIFCLVDMASGRVNVLTKSEMADVCATATPGMGAGVLLVEPANLPEGSFGAWHKIDNGPVGTDRIPISRLHRLNGAAMRRVRRVKHVMADGSTKVYEYR